MPESAQLPLHPRIAPSRILPRHPDNQVDQRGRSRRATLRPRLTPSRRHHQPPMPGQQRPGRDHPLRPQLLGQQPSQRGDHRPVTPCRPRPTRVAPQHCILLPQHQHLDVLRRRRPRQQYEPGQNRHEEPVDKTETHDSRSCHTPQHPRSSAHIRQYWHPTGAVEPLGNAPPRALR